jgi:hypothetical protein
MRVGRASHRKPGTKAADASRKSQGTGRTGGYKRKAQAGRLASGRARGGAEGASWNAQPKAETEDATLSAS